jgi:hypothetical protein
MRNEQYLLCLSRACWLTRGSAVQIFVLGGSFNGEKEATKDGELFTGGAWNALSGVLAETILTDDPKGLYRADNHGWFFGWSNGEGALDQPLSNDTFNSELCTAVLLASKIALQGICRTAAGY